LAQTESPPATEQPNVQVPPQERADFLTRMSKIPVPTEGCFTAQYPLEKWEKARCGKPPKYRNSLARGKPRFVTVGGGIGYFAQVPGTISSATGSFDSVTVSKEYGTRFGGSALYPNTYTLQLNSNTFETRACNGQSNCFGWEQFIFSQSQCLPNTCIFIQYWLIDKKRPCPSAAWIYYPGSPTTASGCYLNSATAVVPPQPLTDLGELKLSGSVSDSDTVMLSTANGKVYAGKTSNLIDLRKGWSGAEFNLVGDCCDSEAHFTGGSNLALRLSTSYGSTTAPDCVTSFSGSTAERNNLQLAGPCTSSGGSATSIAFSESGGEPLQVVREFVRREREHKPRN